MKRDLRSQIADTLQLDITTVLEDARRKRGELGVERVVVSLGYGLGGHIYRVPGHLCPKCGSVLIFRAHKDGPYFCRGCKINALAFVKMKHWTGLRDVRR